MLYTAFYAWDLAEQESSLVFHVLDTTYGWGHGTSSGRRVHKGPSGYEEDRRG